MAAAFWMQLLFVLWYNCNFSIFSWFVSLEGKCFSAKWHFPGGWLCERKKPKKFLGQKAVFGAHGNIQFLRDDFYMDWYIPSTSFKWPPMIEVIIVAWYNWSDKYWMKLCSKHVWSYFFQPKIWQLIRLIYVYYLKSYITY